MAELLPSSRAPTQRRKSDRSSVRLTSERSTERQQLPWVFDGSMDASTYTQFLVGLDEGEPEVLDALPAADLSGESAEGLTPASLAEACGVPDCDWSLTVNTPIYGLVEDCCTTYESAFSDAIQAEAERIAGAYVADESTALGRLLR